MGPWFSAEQVLLLIKHQLDGRIHPFTCGHSHSGGEHIRLIPTETEWRCAGQVCSYTQPYGDMEVKLVAMLEAECPT